MRGTGVPATRPLIERGGHIRAAVLQMNTTEDQAANLEIALGLLDDAAARGARLAVLPEKFHYLGRPEGVSAVKQDPDGPVLRSVSEAAVRHGLYVVAGSVWENDPAAPRAFNTSVLIGPEGQQLARYRKVHMFDVEVGGHVYRESDECLPGDGMVAVALPGGPGADEVVLGLSICYDLRFPELYRALVDLGSQLVAVPAAFTLATGKDHWEVLMRARAIENQVFVLAANQVGPHEPGTESYGRSMIVDPWGVVLAQVADGTGVALADLDLGRLSRVRRFLPALDHRTPAAYGNRSLVRPYG
jgi:deaminated glutathione amidase